MIQWTATSRRTRRRLRVIGRQLGDVAAAGALLQGGFSTVSLIHTASPLTRALDPEFDAVTIVLLHCGCREEEVRAALEQDDALILIAPPDESGFDEMSDCVFPSLEAVLLQATVTSFSAQLAHSTDVTIA